ncbi:MAG TPA: outer membrane beta-barrel protein [Terriglobales bacterium]|nr:outer membrane beta-barrel protein [Terriglobales bacterium]
MRKLHTIAFTLFLFSTASFAQKVDLAVLGGGQASFEPNSNIGTGFALGGNLGVRVVDAPFLDLFVEFPVTTAFKINSKLPASVAQRDYSSLFFTPSLRLKLAPSSPVSPFFSAGAGVARFRQEATATTAARTTTTNAFQFGLGTDFKVAPFVSIRAEMRDYFSGPLEFDATLTRRQHNLVGMAGLVLRF